MALLQDRLVNRVSQLDATIGIFGLGYVGLPLLLRCHEAGFRVIGFDIDIKKVEKLNNGESYIKHIGSERVQKARSTDTFEATSQFSRTSELDVLIICVPTPLGEHREPDLSFLIATLEAVIPYLKPGQLISLESTTYPGTTQEEMRPRIEARGLNVGEDIFLVFSPEREDPGNSKFSLRSIPKIVGGITPYCLDCGIAFYSQIVDRVVPVKSTQVAEMAKLLENIYRAVNIGLVNELKIVAHQMGIDIWEVIDAAATKPFGFTPFYPGPGLGGHCIPIDPFYLTWKAHEYGVHTHFIELAGEVNTSMPRWVLSKVTDALNEHQKAIKRSKVLVLGISYKKNIDDTRESPSVELMQLLHDKGAIIHYCDPHVPTFPKMRKYKFELSSVDLTPSILSSMDCVLVATDHDLFDYEMIQQHSQLVIDVRGRYRNNYPNLVKC